MSRIKTNDMTLQVVPETALGVAATSGWDVLQFDALPDWGPELKEVKRDPISQNRQDERGATVDLDAKVTINTDWTYHIGRILLPKFVMAKWQGPVEFVPTAVTSGAYTVASGGALPAGTLVFARGFSVSGNNGLKKVGAASTSTTINIATALTAETPPSNCLLEIAGVEAASADLQIDAAGNLTSTALDFTTLSLNVGQSIYIGDPLTAGCSFAVAANLGYARIDAIAAHKLTLSKRSQAFSVDTGTGKTIRLFFGPFLKNVPITDSNFLEQSSTFELSYPGLDIAAATMYEYSVGQYANEFSLNLPLANKATCSLGFIGTDCPAPVSVGSRKTGASAGRNPVTVQALNTSAEVGRLRVQKLDETGLTSYFKSATLKLMNNVSAEKAIGSLGAVFMNYGNFRVAVDANIMLTDPNVLAAIRSNSEVTMDFAIGNSEGGYLFDLPKITISSGKRELPKNQTVLFKGNIAAHRDTVLNTSIGISRFPYLPIDWTTL